MYIYIYIYIYKYTSSVRPVVSVPSSPLSSSVRPSVRSSVPSSSDVIYPSVCVVVRGGGGRGGSFLVPKHAKLWGSRHDTVGRGPSFPKCMCSSAGERFPLLRPRYPATPWPPVLLCPPSCGLSLVAPTCGPCASRNLRFFHHADDSFLFWVSR